MDGSRVVGSDPSEGGGKEVLMMCMCEGGVVDGGDHD